MVKEKRTGKRKMKPSEKKRLASELAKDGKRSIRIEVEIEALENIWDVVKTLPGYKEVNEVFGRQKVHVLVLEKLGKHINKEELLKSILL